MSLFQATILVVVTNSCLSSHFLSETKYKVLSTKNCKKQKWYTFSIFQFQLDFQFPPKKHYWTSLSKPMAGGFYIIMTFNSNQLLPRKDKISNHC